VLGLADVLDSLLRGALLVAFTGFVVAARWLELRLTPPWRKVAGAAASVAMLIIAFILVFYREANITLSAD
jgi:hypothetical protein